MKLKGLDDNLANTFYSKNGLFGLSDSDTCNQGGGEPCFALTANDKCYNIEIFKESLFWLILIYNYEKVTDYWFADRLRNTISARLQNGKKAYIELSDGRKIYVFNKEFDESLTKSNSEEKIRKYLDNYRDVELPKQKINAGDAFWTGALNPEYIALGMGGAFSDKYGNSVFAYVKNGYGGSLSRQLAQDGYFGNVVLDGKTNHHFKFHYDFKNRNSGVRFEDWSGKPSDNSTGEVCFIATTNFTGNGYQTDLIADFERTYNGHNFCDDVYKHALETSDKLGKLNRPIIWQLQRDDTIISSNTVWTLAAAGLTVVLGAVGLSAIAGPLIGLAQKAVSGKKGLTLADALDSGIGTALLPKNSPLLNALPLANSYAKKDWAGLATSALGISGLTDKNTIKMLQNNDVMTLLKSSKGQSFDSIAKLAQNVTNLELPKGITNSLKSGTAVQELLNSGDVTQTKALVAMFATASSGGYSASIPTKGLNIASGNNNIQHLIPIMLENDTNHFGANTDPNMHNQLLRMANGFTVNKNVFDGIVLEGLQNKMSLGDGLSDNKEIVLPAGLPLAKRECFAKYLKCKGFSVIVGSETQAKQEITNPTVARTTTSSNKTTVSVSRKEWK